MLLALMLRDGLTEVPAEWLRLEMRWRDPSTPSKSAIADAVTKQVQTNILPADSDVTLEQLGYDEATVARRSEERRVGKECRARWEVGPGKERIMGEGDVVG